MVTKKTEVEDAVEAPLEDVMTVDVEVEKKTTEKSVRNRFTNK
ncbi:hypothetical protein OAC63_02325 [Amylibacter sp.]|nr:hypothetical protein [Amylibacter sp.]